MLGSAHESPTGLSVVADHALALEEVKGSPSRSRTQKVDKGGIINNGMTADGQGAVAGLSQGGLQ
jgi:hypothetical protein